MTWDEWWFQVLGSQGYIERIYSRFPDHLRVPEFRHADVETRHCIREQVLGEAMEAAGWVPHQAALAFARLMATVAQ